jgi:UDP-glucose 4-epimerase
MNILVTGGAGFIGSHVVGHLVADSQRVSVIDDLSAGRTSNLPKGVKFARRASKQIAKDDVRGVDVVVHCAAQVSTFRSVDYPSDDFDRNAKGTFSVFEAVRKYNDTAKIIYTSSRSVLGDIPAGKIADESFPYNPATFYNVHKIYGELLCGIYGGLYGIKSVVLRPSNVYGPGQPYWMRGWYNFIAYWIKLGLEGKPLPIYGTGIQVRDYTYVDDIADAFVRAMENKEALGGTFLLSTGRPVNLNELADMVNSLTGNGDNRQYLPARKGDVQYFVGNSSKAERVLGWRPKVDLEDGLRREVSWVRADLREKKRLPSPHAK